MQRSDNMIVEPPPPVPYLCAVPADAVSRAWYAAHLGTMYTQTGEITVLYYVDPETKHLYAQPHPNTAEAKMRDWGIAEPRAMFRFKLARRIARWIYRERKRLDAGLRRPEGDFTSWWHGYMTSPHPIEPPIPLGMPIDPSNAYATQGWVDAKDWLKKPPKKSDADEDSEEDEADDALSP